MGFYYGLFGCIENADYWGCPDTKEKPFTCFCGAAFTRRDLLKRHHRIAHEEGNANEEAQHAGGLISPDSQPDPEANEQQKNGRQTVEDPAHQQQQQQQQQYDAQPAIPRANVHALPVTAPAVEQWPTPQHATYLQPSQPMIPTDGGHASALGVHPGVTHDADILEAAQLLLPGGYRDPQPQGSVQICGFA